MKDGLSVHETGIRLSSLYTQSLVLSRPLPMKIYASLVLSRPLPMNIYASLVLSRPLQLNIYRIRLIVTNDSVQD